MYNIEYTFHLIKINVIKKKKNIFISGHNSLKYNIGVRG